MDLILDKFKEECGIFGIFGHDEASTLTQLGLFALQHRGQEACGIVSSDGSELHQFRSQGLVADVLNEDVLSKLVGRSAIGHTRYSTAGRNTIKEVQPFSVTCQHGDVAICHNGNLPFAEAKRRELERAGAIFSSTSDTETILHGIARTPAKNIVDAVEKVLRETEGAFSMLFLTPKTLIAVRDPRGFRPLVIGKLQGAWCVASETCAFDLVDAEYIREIEPGEMVIIDETGLTSRKPFEPKKRSVCTFEHVYFSRPDSTIFGRSVNRSRHEMGKRLAIEQPCEADMVVPVPDSGVAAAIGYADESGINFRQAIIRNHYVGRTFIEPSQSIRSFGVRLKLNPIKDFIQGRKVVLVDDSIVRGHDLEKARPNGSRGRCDRGAYADLVSADSQSVLLRRRYSAKGRPDSGSNVGRRGLPNISTPTASATSRSKACSPPSASTPPIPATPAGPANTRPSSPTAKPLNSRQK